MDTSDTKRYTFTKFHQNKIIFVKMKNKKRKKRFFAFYSEILRLCEKIINTKLVHSFMIYNFSIVHFSLRRQLSPEIAIIPNSPLFTPPHTPGNTPAHAFIFFMFIIRHFTISNCPHPVNNFLFFRLKIS